MPEREFRMKELQIIFKTDFALLRLAEACAGMPIRNMLY